MNSALAALFARLTSTLGVGSIFASAGPRLADFFLMASFMALQYGGKKGDLYNVLWILVFGFATLNILALVARHFDPAQSRLTFGELLAILVVLIAITLLGWELLTLFKVFPIKLRPRH
jgi:hypothetical protein